MGYFPPFLIGYKFRGYFQWRPHQKRILSIFARSGAIPATFTQLRDHWKNEIDCNSFLLMTIFWWWLFFGDDYFLVMTIFFMMTTFWWWRFFGDDYFIQELGKGPAPDKCVQFCSVIPSLCLLSERIFPRFSDKPEEIQKFSSISAKKVKHSNYMSKLNFRGKVYIYHLA